MESPNINPALYQLVGPIESLYQLVPIGDARLRANQQEGRNRNAGSLVLVPIHHHNHQHPQSPPPYLDDGGDDDHNLLHHHIDDVENGQQQEFQQLALVPVGGYELELFDEEFYRLAPANELDAPMQLLAIEGPPGFQLVGPVPQLARIRCRFANESPRMVDLVWTDDSNRMYRYAKLAREEFVDITTFEGHQWVFCDALDGELCLIKPGHVKKFVAASAGLARGHRQRISAVHSGNGLTLRKVALRVLAQKIFDAWEEGGGGGAGDYRGYGPPMDLLLQSMRLPPFIQIQLAQFVLSCILYQRKFECSPLSQCQQQIFQWLVQFVRSHTRSMPQHHHFY